MFKVLLQLLTKFDMCIVHVCVWYEYRYTLVRDAQSCRVKEIKKSPVVTWSHVTWSHVTWSHVTWSHVTWSHGPHSIHN